MNRSLRIPVLIIGVVLLVVMQVNAQKLFEGYWEQETISNSPVKTMESSREQKQRVYYKPGKMKTVNLESGEIMILRMDKDIFWSINKNEGTYTEMRSEDMKAGMEKSREAMKKMKQQMENMTPEQKKMMEKMMGGSMKSLMGETNDLQITIKKTGETKTINGYKCFKVTYFSAGEPMFHIWMTDKYRLGTEFVKTYSNMGLLKGKLTDEALKIKGFPIQTEMKINVGMAKMESVSTVSKIVPKSISDSEFELPKGLKKVEMNMKR